MQNKFEGAIAGYKQSRASLQTAQSRIMDADYAQESGRLLKAQILQEASDSVLIQASQPYQGVLNLLSLSQAEGITQYLTMRNPYLAVFSRRGYGYVSSNVIYGWTFVH